MIKLYENVADGAGEALIEREALAAPVRGYAEAFQLVDDLPAVGVDPLPHSLHEFLAAEVEARAALAGEVAVHHHLRADSGVIRSRQPERVEPAHALPAHYDVLQRLDQRVADVQASGDVRRRHDDRKLRPLAVDERREEFPFLPLLVDPLLEVGGV